MSSLMWVARFLRAWVQDPVAACSVKDLIKVLDRIKAPINMMLDTLPPLILAVILHTRVKVVWLCPHMTTNQDSHQIHTLHTSNLHLVRLLTATLIHLEDLTQGVLLVTHSMRILLNTQVLRLATHSTLVNHLTPEDNPSIPEDNLSTMEDSCNILQDNPSILVGRKTTVSTTPMDLVPDLHIIESI